MVIRGRPWPPVAMKRILLLTAVILSFAASSSFADALFLAVKATPYDRQMARIRSVLTTPRSSSSNTLSLNVVNRWMGDLRSIPYGYTTFWKTPVEARSGAPADCKAKSVALYEMMRANGATNVQLIIGKRTPNSRRTHAWLAWNTRNESYVLDPTFNWIAFTTKQVGKKNYQPSFAYAGAKKFRAALPLIAQN